MAGPTPSETGRLAPWVAAIVVFTVGLALTVGGAFAASGALLARQQQQLVDHAQEVGEELGDRLAAYEAAQRALADVLDGAEVFSRGLFTGFTDALELSDRYPEVVAQSFVQVVPPGGVAAFESAQRADGAPAFTVRPSSGERDRYIRTYTTGRARLGADLVDRPGLRAAFARSRDERRTVVVGGFTPLRLLTPVYFRGAGLQTGPERRAALRGWVLLTIDSERLFAELAEQGGLGAVWLADAEGTLLVSSGDPTGTLGAELDVERFGRTWTLEVDAGPPTFPSRRDLVVATLAGGALLSLLLASLVALLIRLRQLRRTSGQTTAEAAKPANLSA